MKYAVNRAFGQIGYQIVRTETLSRLVRDGQRSAELPPAPEMSTQEASPLRANYHSAFRHFRPWSGSVPAGLRPTLAGSVIRDEFHGSPKSSGGWVQTTFPPVGEDFFEWADLLEAVADAGQNFTMAELGAGYGRWCVAGACAARRLGKSAKLIAVEAEPDHFAMLEQHFRDNGLDPNDHTLIRKAINSTGGEVSFSVGHPEEWYGQSIIPPGSRFGDWPAGREIRLEAVRLEEVIADVPFLDLIDMDVQGAEAEIVAGSIELLNERVRRLHIGTHSHGVEDAIYHVLSAAGWHCHNAFRSASLIETDFGPVEFVDGVQSWTNPRLIDGESPISVASSLLGAASRAAAASAHDPGASQALIQGAYQAGAHLRRLLARSNQALVNAERSQIARVFGAFGDDELVVLAQTMSGTPVLDRVPSWSFDKFLEEDDLSTFVRFAIWSTMSERRSTLPLNVPWHGGTRVETRFGSDMSLMLFVARRYEPNEFALLDRVLTSGMTVIDGGANEGAYAVFAAARVGGAGRVVAVEPSPRELALLRRNIGLNEFTHVDVADVALADRDGTLRLLIAEDAHAGQNTLGDFMYAGVAGTGRVDVRATTLDALVRARGIERVDVIKLDLEGAELRALQGAADTLRAHTPLLLMEAAEGALAHQGGSREAMFGALRDLGYRLLHFGATTGEPEPLTGDMSSDTLIAVHPARTFGLLPG